MSKLIFTIIAVLACLALSVVAIPTRGNPNGSNAQTDVFKLMDSNHDGILDKAEVKAYLLSAGCPANVVDSVVQDIFDREDLDKDGFITLEEHRRAASSNTTTGGAGAGMGARSNIAGTRPTSAIAPRASSVMRPARTFSIDSDETNINDDNNEEEVEAEFTVNPEEDFLDQYFELEECVEELSEDEDSSKCLYPLYYNKNSNVYYICNGENDCRVVEIY